MSASGGRHLSHRGEDQDLQHQAEHTHPRRKMSVFGYLSVLFAVAFLLLLVAYFQQKRMSSETADALKQSASAVQSIQAVMDENKTLTEENTRLQSELEDLRAQVDRLSAAQQAQSQAEDQFTQQLSAMDYFWQIDEAYVLKRYDLCRQLIEEMGDLSDLLPDWKATENERFSPAARFREIRDALD